MRRSPIAGFGLFATTPCPAGTVVLRLGGRLVTDDDLSSRLATAAADPNLWYVGPYSFSARRDIEPGEELTNDYATTTGVPGWQMECRCAAVTCRRRVTGRDWSLPDLQRRYVEHWTPGLRRLMARA